MARGQGDPLPYYHKIMKLLERSLRDGKITFLEDKCKAEYLIGERYKRENQLLKRKLAKVNERPQGVVTTL
jgi:hypothetical protein